MQPLFVLVSRDFFAGKKGAIFGQIDEKHMTICYLTNQVAARVLRELDASVENFEEETHL